MNYNSMSMQFKTCLVYIFVLFGFFNCQKIESGNPLWEEFFLLSAISNVISSTDVLYVATNSGLSISSNGGFTWDTRTVANSSLASNALSAVAVSGINVIVGSNGSGLSISTNNGSSFITKVTGDGLGDNVVNVVQIIDNRVYVGTDDGVALSNNGGTSFTNYTVPAGLGNWMGFGLSPVSGLVVRENTVYAATLMGFATSTNGGINYTNTLMGASGLGANETYDVFVDDLKVYVATQSGLSISTDGLVGQVFNNRTVANSSLVSNVVNAVHVIGNTIFAGTDAGLSISYNGGNSFTTITNTQVYAVFVIGNNAYIATQGAGLGVLTNKAQSVTYLTTAKGLANNILSDVIGFSK